MINFRPNEFLNLLREMLEELRAVRRLLEAQRPIQYTFTVPADDPWPTHPDMTEITWSGDSEGTNEC